MAHATLDTNSTAARGTLGIVLALNAAPTAGFAITGIIADSRAVLANALEICSPKPPFKTGTNERRT